MISAPVSNGTPTSDAAADSIRHCASGLRRKVLDYLLKRGIAGATADEAEVALRMPGNTVRPRLVELRAAGLVCLLGQRRETRSGRKAEVYIAAVPRQTDLAEIV